ncbi:MAG TPA: Mur ligase family protein [Blastocatellia bacterium]|nr:Mur ligase family protein [Blastocatellia bacterium]
MRVGEIRALRGPNVYSHRPVLSMRVYLDDLAGKECREFPGFNELLLDLLPGLAKHRCCIEREGGFAERLREGAYFSHVVEHVALELTELAGVPVYHGKTRGAGKPGAYDIIIEYKSEGGTKSLLRMAAEIIESLILQTKGGEPFPLEKRLNEVRKFIAGAKFGPTTSSITEAATRRGIPWKRVGEGSLVQLGYGKHRRLIQAAMTDQTGAIAVDIASDKEITKMLLRDAGIEVPRGILAQSEAEAIEGLEIVGAPGLRMRVSPSEGRSRDAGAAIIDMLYPDGAMGRIPIISITGTNGKTTITRMVAHALSERGMTVGMTTTDGIYIDGELAVEGDTTGPRSAQTVLSDPSVEIAVLETARGGIVRCGLGYDWSDISVISNVRLDHIGQDGIETLDDLLYIKALVAERVREGGTLILNADDERLAQLADDELVARSKKNIVYFSMRPPHALIRRHLDSGGSSYLYKDGWIVEATRGAETRVVRASDIPVTLGGTASFNIANALAAVAVCRAYGLSREEVAEALKGFRGDLHNAGRAALYEIRGGYALLDYGHNPDAFSAVCQMATKWRGRRVTGVIGVPGDRNDMFVEQAGRVAARGFQRIIIREDSDLRGRRSGEIADLLRRAALTEATGLDCRVVLDESAAIRTAIEEIEQGDVVVIFYDKLDAALSLFEQFGAKSAQSFPRPFYSAESFLQSAPGGEGETEREGGDE